MFLAGLVAYAVAALVGGVVGVALVTRYDRHQPTFTFGLFVLAIAGWSVAYVGYFTASTPQWLLAFKQLAYVPAVAVPVLWVAFTMQYTGRSDWLSRSHIAALSVVPVGVLSLVFTVPHHTLFYSSISTTPVDGGYALVTTDGVGHTVNLVYSYGLLMVGNGLLVGELFTDNRLYRSQSLVLLACLATPWIANGVYHLGFDPYPGADISPAVFVASSLPLAVIVQRTELTGFVPVAHERVFHTLDDPVFVFTPSNRILDMNQAARDLATSDAAVLSSDITAILPDPLLEGDELHSDLDASMECTINTRGTQRQYIARLREVDPTSHAGARGCILSLTDITAQKTHQEQLAAKTRVLSRQTTQLTQKNEQLERLASVVSHDLETPLATGETLLHLIETDLSDPPAEVAQSLSDLEAVHHRLRAFAEGLPALARESTDVETPVDCDLETIAREAWAVVDTGGLTLAVESTCRLSGDPSRLQQVFENLFQNSVEHGTRGNPIQSEDTVGHRVNQTGASTVSVGTLQSQSGFFVEDDGPGIPADRREDLLEFGVSTGSGSGYGLAIVRTIIEAHGWSFSVTDGQTGGARFEIATTTDRY